MSEHDDSEAREFEKGYRLFKFKWVISGMAAISISAVLWFLQKYLMRELGYSDLIIDISSFITSLMLVCSLTVIFMIIIKAFE